MAENSGPDVDRLDQINTTENVKLISTFDFTTFYNNLPHKDLVTVTLFDLINFGFNRGLKKNN